MSDLNDRDVEALLGGRAPEGLEPLAALVERLRREACLPADPAVARQHMAAAAAASREAPVPMMVPGSPTRRLWRRRTVFAGLLSTIIGKIFVGAVALAAATAGAGAAGVLPDPVEKFLGFDHDQEQIQDQDQTQDRDQLGDQEQSQTPDQEQIRDRDQLGDQTGTTQQQQQQGSGGNTSTTMAGYGPGEPGGNTTATTAGYGPGEPGGNTTATTAGDGPGEPGGNTTATTAGDGPGQPGSARP